MAMRPPCLTVVTAVLECTTARIMKTPGLFVKKIPQNQQKEVCVRAGYAGGDLSKIYIIS